LESSRKPALANDPDGFEKVYREHVESVARWAARLGGAEIDVDDVVQEVFVAVHKQLPRFRGDSSLRTWLYRITANQVGERRRGDRWRRFWSGPPAEDVASPALTPVENLERREAAARVYRALDAMNDRYRTLVILFELEKLSGQEIAELLGMSLDSVWVTLHRARAQFKKRLEEKS
jgi:RNA polymerase sigma-70 factor (ECF subfamily)